MLIDDIALTLQPSIGAKTAIHLINCFGTAEAIFAASVEELVARAELNERIAHEVIRKKYHRQAEREAEYALKNNIHIIASGDAQYPELLRECNDYPHVIYLRGDVSVLTKRLLTIVGTRRMTPYGESVCTNIICGLSQMFPDLAIVSGLAFGIDGAAHRAALSCNIPTIGVIANPVMKVSPLQNVSLSEQMIRQGGGVLSELHSGCDTKGQGFVPRNRIVAGLSLGTLVVQSPSNGGSLITAHMADGYNRVVMAIPGRIGDGSSVGTNALIKNRKAQMVCSPEDVATELGWESTKFALADGNQQEALSKDAAGLLSCIREGAVISMDELMDVSGLSMSDLSSLLLDLEFAGLIRTLPGHRFERG